MFKTEFCEVEYREDMGAVLCSWKRFCRGDDYRDPLRYGLKLLVQNKCRNWITDTTNGFENEPEDTAWLLDEFIPQTIESPCENLFFILKDDSPIKEDIQSQIEALSSFFSVFVCKHLDEIRKKIIPA